MEDDYGADLSEVFRAIDTAEVLVVRFAIVEQRLLVDARRSESEGPLIRLVPPVGSVEERFRHLKSLRPRFPLPERMLTFVWQRQVESLRASGVWQRLVERLTATGWPGMDEQCAAVWEDLVRAERTQVMAAIRGEPGYRSLWERSG